MPKGKSQIGRVRIIAGHYRHRWVNFLGKSGLRPTSDRIRETVFNWLMPYIEDASCLDLFAGSGVLGFEALSRGASQVVFVDADKEVTDTIQQHIELFQIRNAQVMHARIPNTATRFLPMDIIFLDPPFHQQLLKPTLEWLNQQTCIQSNTIIYMECEKELHLEFLHVSWDILKDKTIGQVRFMLIRKKL